MIAQREDTGFFLFWEQDVKGSQKVCNGDSLQKQLFRRTDYEYSTADQPIVTIVISPYSRVGI